MVYLIIGFGGLFAMFWVLALVFATRTTGERSLGIPGFWIVVFGAIAGFGLTKYSEATSNPEQLVKEKYIALQGGLNYADLVAQVGQQPIDMSGMDEEEVKVYDLTTNRIKMPSEITGRLAPGIFEAARQDSELGIEIFPGIENYEADTGASKRNAQNKSFKDDVGPSSLLGSNAVVNEKKRQGHGLIDLKIRFYLEDTAATDQLKEDRKKERTDNKEEEEFEQTVMQPIALEGKEWFVTEGIDWTYEDNMTAAQVAEALAKAIDAMPEFIATYELDEDALIPNSNLSVKAGYCLVDANDEDCPEDKINPLAGDAGNKVRAQVMTGDNKAVLLGRKTDGSAQQFFGGADEVQLVFWEEAEPFLDDDFNSTPRLIVAGLLRKKLVALGQRGFDITNSSCKKYTIDQETCSEVEGEWKEPDSSADPDEAFCRVKSGFNIKSEALCDKVQGKWTEEEEPLPVLDEES